MSLGPPGCQKVSKQVSGYILEFSNIFWSVQKVIKKYQNCLWEGLRPLPETILILFDQCLETPDNIQNKYFYPGHLFGHLFDTLGGQGHSGDTLGETPVGYFFVIFGFIGPRIPAKFRPLGSPKSDEYKLQLSCT